MYIESRVAKVVVSPDTLPTQRIEFYAKFICYKLLAKIRVLKVNFVCGFTHLMNNEILVAFLFKNQFVYQTTQIRDNCGKISYLKI